MPLPLATLMNATTSVDLEVSLLVINSPLFFFYGPSFHISSQQVYRGVRGKSNLTIEITKPPSLNIVINCVFFYVLMGRPEWFWWWILLSHEWKVIPDSENVDKKMDICRGH